VTVHPLPAARPQRISIDLLVTGHPDVRWTGIRGDNSTPPKPP
jgi:hypothetical protein